MRATVMPRAHEVRIENVPDARIVEPTDALIRVTRACICGSDLWPYNGGPNVPNQRMGHEAIGVVEEIGAEAMPLVVFVTAYNRHAVKAFEVHALDYVLKPVDPQRLREAIERAASTLSQQRAVSLADRLEGLLSAAEQTLRGADSPMRRSPGRFVVRDADDRVSLLEIEHIEWFESEGNYVRVHSRGRSYLMRRTMDRVAQQLAARRSFIRVRRSAIVNVRAVASLERNGKSSFIVHLRSGANVVSSRFYQPGIRRLLREDWQ